MATYPDYVHRTLAEAREDGQWHAHQNDAAALCFDVLALYPDCREASDLVYEIFCDEWTIYQNRKALQRLIDEWDDRPHQQRRRLALSFRYMGSWHHDERVEDAEEAEEREDKDELPLGGPARNVKDVKKLLHEGKMQLLEAYCLGDEECVNFAWPVFMKAIEKARDPKAALWWIARQYADLGFFADAVEVLAELCSRYPGQQSERARRLLAEVRWWRDNAHCIPWIPPAGDGSRYRRIMKQIEPDAPSDEETIQDMRERLKEAGNQPTWQPTISPDLAALVESQLDPSGFKSPKGHKPVVDWSFLDEDFGAGDEPTEFEKRLMKRMPKDMREYTMRQYLHRHPIKPPSTPPCYHPDDELFDTSDVLGDEDDDLGDMDELDD
jgi:hypothetical protein